MVKSMTGFGKTTVESGNKKIVIEIKSLNSKQLDLNLQMPNHLQRERNGNPEYGERTIGPGEG